MDVPVYEAEQVIIIRVEGRDPYPIHRCPVRSFEPIRAYAGPGHANWVEVSACDEPTAVCVAPPGSKMVRINGKLWLSAPVPRLDRSKPLNFDADWLLGWAKSGAYGFRLREPRPPGHVDGAGEPPGVGGAVGTQEVAAAGQADVLGAWGEFRDLDELIRTQSQRGRELGDRVEPGVVGVADLVVVGPREAGGAAEVGGGEVGGDAVPFEGGEEVHGSIPQGAVAGEADGGRDDLAAPVGAGPDAVRAAAGDVGPRRAAVHGGEPAVPQPLGLADRRPSPRPGWLFALDD